MLDVDGLVGPLVGANLATLGKFKLQCRGEETALHETFGCLRAARLPRLRSIKIEVLQPLDLQMWHVREIDAMFQLGPQVINLLHQVDELIAVLPLDKSSTRAALVNLCKTGVFKKKIRICS